MKNANCEILDVSKFRNRLVLSPNDKLLIELYKKINHFGFRRTTLNMESVKENLSKINICSDSQDNERITDKLFAAIVLKKFKLARILASGGVDIKATLSSGVTPLMAACDAVTDDSQIEKKCSVITCLIENGAEINAKDKFGRTPLHYACINGCKEVINMLKENGADNSIRDLNGKPPKFYSEDNFSHQSIRTRRDSIAVSSLKNTNALVHPWDSSEFLDALME